MKRLWMSTVSAALAAMMWSPQVQAKGSVDAFLLAPANRSLPDAAASAPQRGLRISSTEARLGVPTFVINDYALRSGGKLAARPVTQASADAAARGHLRGVADMYRLTRSDVENAELQAVHLPKNGPGAVIARYGRRVNGIEVFRSELRVVMNANHELVALSGYLAPRQVGDEQAAQDSSFVLSAPQAISRAFSDMTGATLDARSLSQSGSQGDYSHYAVVGKLASGHSFGNPPRSKKVLFPLPDGLVPAYYVEVNAGSADKPDADYYSYVISARDGSVLFKHNLTESESFSYRVYADAEGIPFDGPQGTEATPHPTGEPDGYQAPLDRPANLVTLQNYPFSRNDPWLAPNATQTTGNNVDAYADLGGGDGFQPDYDLRASLSDTANRAFDYQFDLGLSPEANQNQRLAATVNLFYMNNFLHDWFYDAGFDEAAGNAQMNNYGRGGLEGDSIRAEAQDSGGRNNANMSTPADGARPRMQQYIFDGIAELIVTAPASVAGSYDSYSASFGPATFNVSAELALPPTSEDPAVDEGLRLGCADANGTNPYTGTPFAGKIAVIERGSCSFVFKVLNAQNAGAVGVIVTNSATGAPGGMGASGDPAIDNAIVIPSRLVTKPIGDAWRAELAKPASVHVRMRLNSDLDRDGTLDNQIIAHEWGHYISNRLIGNASGLTNNQGRAMGEGWGDFTAMLITVRPEDIARQENVNWSGVYGIAAYTMSGGANQGYYWGIRRVPYTTDMTKNGLTLKHIANGVPLPDHPVAFGANGASNAQIHNAGEIWATMLWECYASLLNAHPFAEAQDRMKRYLVAGYKATPSQPTFLEARDAILAAAAAADPADYHRFLAAFAKRGAGLGAKVPDRESSDHIGVVESFQSGNTLELVSIKLDDAGTSCDRDGVLDAGETGYLNVTVRNVGAGDLSGTTATVALNGSSAGVVASLPGGNTLTFGNIARGATATARLPIALSEAPVPNGGGLATLGLDVTFPVFLVSGQKVATLRESVNYDEIANSTTIDSVDTTSTTWTGSTTGNDPLWKVVTSNGQRYWHGDARSMEADAQLISPLFRGAPGQAFALRFKQRYSFEMASASPYPYYYDGAVLELSVDSGPWTDVFEFDWYTGTTTNAGYVWYIDSYNPFLGDRPGYVGMSAGFPDWQTVTVNFGPQFWDRDVRVRFRIGTDAYVGAYGWDLDDIQVAGVVTPPFIQRVPEAYTGVGGGTPTCNVRPVADAGLTQTVYERTPNGELTVITLNGSGSFDPDGAAGSTLSYQWTQVGGPPVTLSSATDVMPTFTADVSQNTVFTFELVVHDGIDASAPKTTQVGVVNVNRAPTAVARVANNGPTEVAERSGSVTLDATGSSDPDGEPLNFTWVQMAGTTVTFDDPTSATPTFTIPEVAADTDLRFKLVVDDGIDAGEATLTIKVNNVDRAPTVDAGPNQTASARSTVTLTATASDPDGDAITGYAWTQVDGPAVELTGADTATPSFIAPHTAQNVVLRFSVVATANGASSAPSTVEVTITRDNRKPTIHGATSVTVDERSAVTLDVSAEDADGDALAFVWTQVAGPSVTLNGANSAQLSFTAPEVQSDTVLLFRVQASDDLEASETLEVAVTVKNVPLAPVAKVVEAVSANEGDTVTLNASGSNDPDAQQLTYHWEQVSGPAVTLSGANSPVATFVVPELDKDATATFRVTVTDPDGLSSTANVVVQMGQKGGGCSVGGNGLSGALVPGLSLLGLLLSRRRRKA